MLLVNMICKCLNRSRIASTVLIGHLLWVTPLASCFADDRQQSIYIDSNSLIKDQKQGTAIYEGDVLMQQGGLSIRGDRVTLYLKDGDVIQITAVGQPAILEQIAKTPEQTEVEAHALTIVYRPQQQSIELNEQASLDQNGSVTKSNKIVYDIAAARVQAGGDNGHVNIVIQPREGE
jgi:lipopolysaccharide export system protein LptA